jgi:hypothetical protein
MRQSSEPCTGSAMGSLAPLVPDAAIICLPIRYVQEVGLLLLKYR